jgi:hypothetical protein
VNSVRPKTLRFAPPLVVSAAEVDRALEILDAALGAVAAGLPEPPHPLPEPPDPLPLSRGERGDRKEIA